MNANRNITRNHTMTNVDRYRALTAWARRRYTETDSRGRKSILTRAAGLRRPSRFLKIEDMAAARYLGTRERFADFRLNECPGFFAHAYDFA